MKPFPGPYDPPAEYIVDEARTRGAANQRQGAAEERKCITFLREMVRADVYNTGRPGVKAGKRGRRGTMRTPGTADLLVFIPWRHFFFFWEVKSGKATLTPEQRQFRDNCLLCQVGYGSGNLEALQDYLVTAKIIEIQPPYNAVKLLRS